MIKRSQVSHRFVPQNINKMYMKKDSSSYICLQTMVKIK